ncbi:hypothetical protein [Leucobacter chinensis]|uniref:hypothetical protein n=1 Tax=Leucobacter chinensis TaxID=2851010 RepID=UPI001C226DF6|nr:hypothetical protein [Leucobacter chinensis]
MTNKHALVADQRSGPTTWQWITGLVCLVLAGVLLVLIPDSEVTQRPFEVRTPIGETGVGRALEVRVSDVEIATELRSGAWSGESTWLVADTSAAARLSESGTTLAYAMLRMGGEADGSSQPIEYRASERVKQTLFQEPLTLGSALNGQVVFELPEGASGPATLLFGVNGDPRVDSVIAFDIDLDEVQRVPERVLTDVQWSEQ